MLKVYSSPSCSSCRKVKKWLQKQNIPFVEQNFFTKPMKREDLIEILQKSENGTEDIISTRSNAFKECGVDLNSMRFNELIDFILEHPSILRRPIIVSDHRIQVGYDEEEIEIFLPRLRDIIHKSCTPSCQEYATCAHWDQSESNSFKKSS